MARQVEGESRQRDALKPKKDSVCRQEGPTVLNVAEK